jgi:O-antigen/teichoic acid export membrane protein
MTVCEQAIAPTSALDQAPDAGQTSAGRHLLRGTAQRLGWGVGDQIVSSLSNFVVVLYVVRVLGATQFGAFTLAYVTYGFALSAARGLATSPLQVRFSGVDDKSWRGAVSGCTGTALAVGLVLGGCVLAVGILLTGPVSGALVALGITLPGLLLQDSWRHAFFAHGRGGQAFLNDSVWALALVPGLLVLRATDHQSASSYILIWGLTAGVAALVGPLQARVVPRLSQARVWLSTHRDLALPYLAETAASPAAGQLRTYAVGVILGLAAAGYLQAGSTLLGPFMVLFFGIALVTVPEAVRALRRSDRHLRLFCLLAAIVLGCLCLIWGGSLLVLLPLGLGDVVLGSTWHHAYALVLPLTLAVAGSCVSTGATAGLHALKAPGRSLRAGLISAVLYLLFGVVGAVVWGLPGTAYGIVIATWLGAVCWWWEFREEMRTLEARDRPILSPVSAHEAAALNRKRGISRRRLAVGLNPAVPSGE